MASSASLLFNKGSNLTRRAEVASGMSASDLSSVDLGVSKQ
jgi:hypothetical protein